MDRKARLSLDWEVMDDEPSSEPQSPRDAEDRRREPVARRDGERPELRRDFCLRRAFHAYLLPTVVPVSPPAAPAGGFLLRARRRRAGGLPALPALPTAQRDGPPPPSGGADRPRLPLHQG